MINTLKKKLNKFDSNYYLSRKNYQVASALSALETTTEIIDTYLTEEKQLTKGEYVLRLYALLQALFVGVDSLYSLSIALTGTKNFININSNTHLRNLKYVRNNVVGHPSNRIYGGNDAYCILDINRVTKNFFSYNIYTKDSVKVITVDNNELIQSYCKETNNFLDELYSVITQHMISSEIKVLITDVLDHYYRNGHYINELNKFIDKYRMVYPSAKREQHRIIWRYELILKLDAISNNNTNLTDVINYCIGLELNKMYRHIFGKDYKHRQDFGLPSMILSVYRFFNRNPEYRVYISHLNDHDDPLFFESLKAVYEGVSLKKMQGAMDYLGFIITLYMANQSDLIYAIALPISEYKEK